MKSHKLNHQENGVNGAVKNTKGKQGEGREGMVNPVIVIGCIN